MKSITWVRHGESEWNAIGKWQGQTDVPLTELGRSQARALGRRLARLKLRFDLVVSSDLSRASETAELALAELEAGPLLCDPRLREIKFGSLEGKTKAEFSDQEREHAAKWWRSPYDIQVQGGGESMSDLRRRVDAWMSELPDQGAVLVFSHGGVIRDRLWRETSPPKDGEWSFSIDNTSLTVIDYGRRNTIRRVNDHAHLEELL